MSSQPERPLVSIVTPSFQQAPFLEAAIRSVLDQTYPRIEYGVVDGGSTDGSLEILRRYADRLGWWVSEPDAGQTAALNKGFARATGQVFAWLNSDDVMYPHAVAEAVAALDQNPHAGMVYGGADYLDSAGQVLGRFPAGPADYRRLRRGSVHIPQQAAFFRSRLWRLAGPLDETFRFAMDYDLWVRISALSPLVHVPRPWAGFRLHPAGKTTAHDDLCWPEMMRVHRRLGGGWFSWMNLRFQLRRAAGPLWPLRLRLQGLWPDRPGGGRPTGGRM